MNMIAVKSIKPFIYHFFLEGGIFTVQGSFPSIAERYEYRLWGNNFVTFNM